GAVYITVSPRGSAASRSSERTTRPGPAGRRASIVAQPAVGGWPEEGWSRRQQARRITMRLRLTGAGLALIAALVGVGIAYAAVSTSFSGFEILPGYHGYDCPVATTCATTFSGWTDAAFGSAPPQLRN